MGLGSAYFHIKKKWSSLHIIFLKSGLFLLSFFGVVVLFDVDESWRVIIFFIQLLLLGGYFFYLGIGISLALCRSQLPLYGWALHILGVLVGYVLSHYGLIWVGANAIIAVTALSLIFLGFDHRVLFFGSLVLFMFSYQYGGDGHLERMRHSISFKTDDSTVDIYRTSKGPALLSKLYKEQLVLWSEYGQVRLVHTPPWWMCLQSGKRAFKWLDSNTKNNPHFLHRLERSSYYDRFLDETIFISGIGGGRVLRHFNPRIYKSIYAVERDPSLVRFFSSSTMQNNMFDLRKVNIFNADSRYILESHPRKYDVIIFESSKGQKSFSPVQAPYLLYTPEAVSTYIKRLNKNGFVHIFLTVKENYQLPYTLMLGVFESFKKAGFAINLKHTYHLLGGELHLRACENQECLDGWMSRLGISKGTVTERELRDNSGEVISDNNPFVVYTVLDRMGKLKVLFTSIMVLVVSLILTLLIGNHCKTKKLKSNLCIGNKNYGYMKPYFFCVGLIYVILQTHIFYTYRSFLGDELYTFLRSIIYFLCYGAVGAFLVQRWKGISRYWTYSFFLVPLHIVFLFNIPFDLHSFWLREFFFFFAMLPAGLFCGLLMPYGLSRIEPSKIGLALFADSMGTLSGFFLFLLIALPFGLDSILWSSVLLICLFYWIFKKMDQKIEPLS